VLNFEIPHPQHLPTGSTQRFVLGSVAGEVALDFLVPIAAPAARLPLARMAMPERSIDENRQPPARESEIDPAAGAAPMTAPATHPGAPERATQQQLGFGVAAADRRHDPAAALARGGRGAKRV
jgi:hypothetical protein